MKQYIVRQTQLSDILLVLATSFSPGRPSGQNIYKNLKASAYKVLFVNVMGSHLEVFIIKNYTIVNFTGTHYKELYDSKFYRHLLQKTIWL
jgi:hypothetical protein